MLKQHDGVVINIGTPLVNHGLGGVPITAQMASKGAIHALTIQLAAEFGKDNIRVNMIAPGTIRTARTEKIWAHDEGRWERLASTTAVGRLGTPDDVARTFVALATALTHVTGQVLVVDGGQLVKR